jgi:Carbohydrate family 9 binding domain-like
MNNLTLIPKIMKIASYFKYLKNKCLWVLLMGVISFGCSQSKSNLQNNQNKTDYFIENHDILVDGKIDDWKSIDSILVNREENIWIGEGLSKTNWEGDDDLSFSWKACHKEGKIYFLIQVKDDTLSNFNQKYAWENDCVEIHLDHQNIKGDRIIGIGSENSLEDRFGKRLKGHEMQFLPSTPPKVFFDDSKNIYYTDSDQTNSFQKDWHGETVTSITNDGYLLEIGFAIPNYYVQSGCKIGLDIAVCDDDGKGRKSLMVSSGFKGPFWLTMDNFHTAELK